LHVSYFAGWLFKNSEYASSLLRIIVVYGTGSEPPLRAMSSPDTAAINAVMAPMILIKLVEDTCRIYLPEFVPASQGS